MEDGRQSDSTAGSKTMIAMVNGLCLGGGNELAVAYGGYALAKAGRLDEAKAALAELLKLSNERFVPASHIAMIYNGLGEQDNTFIWLERGFEQRDPKMNFLKVEPKWNNLRNEPRFIDLMRRMNLQ